jgi:hypothetical protein
MSANIINFKNRLLRKALSVTSKCRTTDNMTKMVETVDKMTTQRKTKRAASKSQHSGSTIIYTKPHHDLQLLKYRTY